MPYLHEFLDLTVDHLLREMFDIEQGCLPHEFAVVFRDEIAPGILRVLGGLYGPIEDDPEEPLGFLFVSAYLVNTAEQGWLIYTSHSGIVKEPDLSETELAAGLIAQDAHLQAYSPSLAKLIQKTMPRLGLTLVET